MGREGERKGEEIGSGERGQQPDKKILHHRIFHHTRKPELKPYETEMRKVKGK